MSRSRDGSAVCWSGWFGAVQVFPGHEPDRRPATWDSPLLEGPEPVALVEGQVPLVGVLQVSEELLAIAMIGHVPDQG